MKLVVRATRPIGAWLLGLLVFAGGGYARAEFATGRAH
jgi:hypothetical protein